MKKQFGKIALAVVFAMVVCMLAPTVQTAQAATKKTFTYAEQISGDKVTTLFMDKGEKVDLKFIGVSDWRSYKLQWTTSNSKVATVNTAGVITAHAEGEATIELKIGDGSTYTSTGVKVYVGKQQEVTIGTASAAQIKSYTLELGKTATLKANGLKDNVGSRYTFEWSSTDTSVAKISNTGIITTVAPGLTVIQLTVKKAFSGEKMQAEPIALLVTEKGSYVPSGTPTPTPKPTATPTPTVKPTAAVTPVPTDQYVPYTAKLESDRCILLTFDSKVDYKTTDIELYQLVVAGNTVIPVKWEVANVTADSTGKKLQVVPANALANGERYLIKAGSADVDGTTLNVVIGAPNRIEITYECLGKTGVAYAYDETASIDVPVTLSYRLYYGTIDVTETYRDRGYMSYEFAANKYYDNAAISDNILTFYAPNVSTIVTGTFTYYGDNGTSKDIKATVAIKSQKLPQYGISGVIQTTIIDGRDNNLAKIDWTNTTNQVIANTENAKVVAMIADTYGNFYVTDERGVDKSKKIYSINDPEQLFSKFGYGIEFNAADPNQILIGRDGSMYPFKAASRAVVLVTLTNNGMNGNSNTNKNIGVCQINVLEESKLTSVTADKTGVTLAASALSGYENRFCTTDVEILLKDQYGNKWNGDYNLEVSSAITDINNALDGSYYAPARIDGNVLHIDAANIKRVTTRTTVSFVVTETITKKKVTVNVTLQNPTVTNGEIKVTGWSLGLQNSKISLGDPNNNDWVQYATIEAFKLSSNGIKVGLYDNLKVLETVNYAFTTSNCHAGEVYVLVKGPDGKVVSAAANETSVGVYVDELNHCVKVNVSAPISSGSLIQESLSAGTYTVMATRIVSVGTTVQKVTQTATFTVVDNTKNVTFRSMKSVSTPLTISGSKDLAGVKAIIESVFTFNLGGELWTTMSADRITDVEYVVNGNTIVIRKVEFAVPVNSDELYGMSYKKTCDVNKAVKTGVSE